MIDLGDDDNSQQPVDTCRRVLHISKLRKLVDGLDTAVNTGERVTEDRLDLDQFIIGDHGSGVWIVEDIFDSLSVSLTPDVIV